MTRWQSVSGTGERKEITTDQASFVCFSSMKRARKKNEDLDLEKPYASCSNMKDSKKTTVLYGINNDQAGVQVVRLASVSRDISDGCVSDQVKLWKKRKQQRSSTMHPDLNSHIISSHTNILCRQCQNHNHRQRTWTLSRKKNTNFPQLLLGDKTPFRRSTGAIT